LRLERNSQFSHLTEAVAKVAMLPANGMQLRTPQRATATLSGMNAQCLYLAKSAMKHPTAYKPNQLLNG